jgi:hypothetical protein
MFFILPFAIVSSFLMRSKATKPILPPNSLFFPRKKNTLTKTTDTTKTTNAPNQNVIPTPEQIEKMRKKNEKFRLKRFKRSQEEQK